MHHPFLFGSIGGSGVSSYLIGRRHSVRGKTPSTIAPALNLAALQSQIRIYTGVTGRLISCGSFLESDLYA